MRKERERSLQQGLAALSSEGVEVVLLGILFFGPCYYVPLCFLIGAYRASD